MLLDIAKESSDWFPPLKSALGGVCALVKHHEVMANRVAVSPTDTIHPSNLQMSRRKLRNLSRVWTGSRRTPTRRRSTETRRRRSGVRNCLGTLADCLSHRPCRRSLSVLEKIEKRSQELLSKGSAVRFIDKGEDSKEVARLVEQLREAIVCYQVSIRIWILCRVPLTWEGRSHNNKQSMTKSRISL